MIIVKVSRTIISQKTVECLPKFSISSNHETMNRVTHRAIVSLPSGSRWLSTLMVYFFNYQFLLIYFLKECRPGDAPVYIISDASSPSTSSQNSTASETCSNLPSSDAPILNCPTTTTPFRIEDILIKNDHQSSTLPSVGSFFSSFLGNFIKIILNFQIFKFRKKVLIYNYSRILESGSRPKFAAVHPLKPSFFKTF